MANKNRSPIANRLAAIRHERGLTQADTARCSISRSLLARYECGINVPSTESICILADALNVSTDLLLCRESLLNPYEGGLVDTPASEVEEG